MRPPLALADLGGHREHLNPPLILNSVLMVSLPSVLIYLDPPVTQSLTHSLPTYPAQCCCCSVYPIPALCESRKKLKLKANQEYQNRPQAINFLT